MTTVAVHLKPHALVATYIMADSSHYDGIDDPGLKPSSPPSPTRRLNGRLQYSTWIGCMAVRLTSSLTTSPLSVEREPNGLDSHICRFRPTCSLGGD